MDDDPTNPRDPRVPRNPVILPPDTDVVHEEERTRVLADGTRLREVDRVEQRSGLRERLPWILTALLLLVIIGGVAIWFFTRSTTKPVPAVVGLRIDNAVTRIQADGFKVAITRQSNSRQPGIVFGQDPAANAKADSGSSVRLLVSSGPGNKTVPNAVGLAQADARSRLVSAGFAVTTAQVFSDQPAGTVVAQDPAAGDHVSPGTKVRLNVSKGAGSVDVPSEVGVLVDQAQSDLTAKGFKTRVVHVASEQPIDTVVSQSPSGGQARKGATVALSVSEGPPTATTTQTTTTSTAPATTGTTGTTTTG